MLLSVRNLTPSSRKFTKKVMRLAPGCGLAIHHAASPFSATADRGLSPHPIEERMNSRQREAKKLDRKLVELLNEVDVMDKRRGIVWVRAGQICLKVRKGKLYRELGFDNYEDYIEKRVGKRKSQVALATGAVEDLLGDVGERDLAEIALNTAQVLRQIPVRQRTKALIQAAKTQTEQQFRKTVSQKIPDLKIEQTISMTFHLEFSAAGIVKQALTLSATRNGNQSREQGLEDLAQNYLQDFESELSAESLTAEPEQPRIN
jgi:hypothetical protein